MCTESGRLPTVTPFGARGSISPSVSVMMILPGAWLLPSIDVAAATYPFLDATLCTPVTPIASNEMLDSLAGAVGSSMLKTSIRFVKPFVTKTRFDSGSNALISEPARPIVEFMRPRYSSVMPVPALAMVAVPAGPTAVTRGVTASEPSMNRPRIFREVVFMPAKSRRSGCTPGCPRESRN